MAISGSLSGFCPEAAMNTGKTLFAQLEGVRIFV
jgi:hypothetical protein